MNLDDLSQFDSQLQLSLAAWGHYYEDYIRLCTGIKILQTSRGTRDQDYEIRLVHSFAERRLNEKWSIGEFLVIWMDCTVAKCFQNGVADHLNATQTFIVTSAQGTAQFSFLFFLSLIKPIIYSYS